MGHSLFLIIAYIIEKIATKPANFFKTLLKEMTRHDMAVFYSLTFIMELIACGIVLGISYVIADTISDIRKIAKTTNRKIFKELICNAKLDRRTFIKCSVSFYLLIILSCAIFWINLTAIANANPDSDTGLVLIDSGKIIVVILAAVIYIFIGMIINICRLHDLNKSAWYGFLLCIPIVNLYMYYKMFFKPSVVENNRYKGYFFDTIKKYKAMINEDDLDDGNSIVEIFKSNAKEAMTCLAVSAKINRTVYAMRLFACYAVLVIFNAILPILVYIPDDTFSILDSCITILCAVIIGISVRQRLHDLRKSGKYIFLLFVPIVGMYYFLYLLFVPGKKDETISDNIVKEKD